MKDCSAISRMWRCAAVLVALVGVSGCQEPFVGLLERQNQTSALERLKRINYCRYCNLRGADLQGADLQGASLWGADLREANLKGAYLGGANLREADLQGAKLDSVGLQGATLREANLYRADLRGADLGGADLQGANLYGADLRGADLGGADLQGAKLYVANLRGANLGGAELRKANLREANLYGADLRGADLQNADLQNADLEGADLREAYLYLANLEGANLRGAKLDNDGLAIARASGAIGLDPSGSEVAKAVPEKPKPAKRIAKAPPPTKPSLPTAKARDTTPPTITIASAITVKTESPTVKGRATDNTQVAQVTVEGVAVDLKSDGSFSFKYYVPVGGANVKIEAFDKWGNRSERTVKITRAVAKATDQRTLAKLNPTNIRGRSNKDAIALIIGVAKYFRAPAATYADNDANVFGDFAHRALGIPRSNIKMMINDKASLVSTRVAIQRWLRGRIEEGKSDVFVFFAGHGLASPDGKDLYLLPYDGETSLLEGTALLRRELFEVIGKAKPKSATIFLDTCYSGLSRGKEILLASARGIVVTPKPQSIPKGFTVLSAASGQQISSGLDEAKHGLFSYYLMKGMEGDADANKDRKITAGELHAYLGKNVQKQAIRLGREQTPELSGDGERVLVRW